MTVKKSLSEQLKNLDKMKRYSELGYRTLQEATNDLRRLNDPQYLSYNDNYYVRSLRNKYGMTTLELARVIRDLKDENDERNV